MLIAQLTVSGILQGAIYALVALSMTIIYRGTTLVNFGHGDFLMAGAFVFFLFVSVFGVPYLAAALFTLLLMFVMGALMQQGVMARVKNSTHATQVMTTIAVGFLLRSLAVMLWGRRVLSVQAPSFIPDLSVMGVYVGGAELLVAIVTIVVTLAFVAWLYKTRSGDAVRALFDSERGARLVGINVPRLFVMIWGVGLLIGGVGSVLLVPMTQLYPDMGGNLLLRAFAAMAIGGFGSLSGALLGGFILGVLENYAGMYVATALVEVIPYLVILIVLVVKPTGLFGQRGVACV